MSEQLLALPKTPPADLEWASHPTHPATTQASAFEVRKLLDLRSLSVYSRTEVLVIVDDRQDAQKAAEEMGLISRLANAQSLSSLRSAAGALQTVQ